VHDWHAWEDDEPTLRRITVEGTANAARVATAIGARFVLISTIGVYGTPPPPICDDRTATQPTSPYGRAKLAAEQVARREQPDAIVLRCAVVYGPGDRGNVGRLIDAVARGRAFVVGDGANRKSLLFSENLADRILACLEADAVGTWCVADSPAPTQRALVNEIARALDRRPPLAVPLVVALAGAGLLDVAGRARLSRVQRWSATIRVLTSETCTDGSTLDRRLEYRPRFSLKDGMTRTVAWFRHSSQDSADT
jgi:UDP-glucose 4-epimerase